MSLEIILFSIWILITEILFIWFLHIEKNEKEEKTDWLGLKFIAILNSIFLTAVIFGLYLLSQQIGLINLLKYLGMTILGILGIALFFYLNYLLKKNILGE